MGKRGKNDRNVIRVSFRAVKTTIAAMTGGFQNSTYSVDPSLTPRLTSISDQFGLFRFTQLNVRLYPGINGTTGAGNSYIRTYLGYEAEQSDTPPASILAASEMEYVIFNVGAENATGVPNVVGLTVPREMRIPVKVLVGDEPNKWWKTKASSNVETWSEVQGQLQHGFDATTSSTSTYNQMFEIWGMCEFSQPLSASTTPFEYPVEVKSMPCPPSGALVLPTPGAGRR